MTTLLLSHPACSSHDMGAGHPEQPARLAAIQQVLQGEEFELLIRSECPEATLEQIERAHPLSYIESIREHIPESGLTSLDGDTLLCPHSFKAALRSAGGAIRAVDAIFTGDAHNSFCAIRPPGHHAEREQAMGFCLFNNAAIAAYHARDIHGAERVAVIDFDVHHGNGTQDILWQEPDIFYGSTHQMPLYPGTGATSETGVGNIFNTPLPDGADGELMRQAYRDRLLPALADFSPDILILSAGFDAHEDDPLAGMRLTTGDFKWITQVLCDFADKSCSGRIVSLLEGGYNLQALSESVATHIDVLMEAGV